MRSEISNLNKYLFWATIVILTVISYFIIKPFIGALIVAFILSYLIRPVYLTLRKKINHRISGLLSILLVIIIIIAPISLVIGGIWSGEGR